MKNDIDKILFTTTEIEEKIKTLAQKINEDYADKELLVVTLLRSAFMFVSDLSRHLTINPYLDFIVVTRYGYGDMLGKEPKILKDLDVPVNDKHILIIENIVDNGKTLFYIKEGLKIRKPLSIKTCTLFNKPKKREVEIEPDYNGFVVPDQFVVGYGLDYKQKYRNLPYLATLKKEIITPLV